MKLKKLLSICMAFVLAVSISVEALAAGAGTGNAEYSNMLTITEGFTYTNEISYNSSGKRVETFAIEASTSGEVFPIVMACDTIYGGMTAEQIIEYAESLGYNVLGAVNADFFSTNTKVPMGAVVENGEYKSSPEGENVLVFSEDGAFISEAPDIVIELNNNGKDEVDEEDENEDEDEFSGEDNAGKSVSLTHLNKMRADTGGLYLYTSAFSTVSTRTSSSGWAVRFKITEGGLSIGGSVSLTVEEIIENGTSYEIGDGYIVLTAADECGMGETLDSFSVGDSVTLTVTASDELLNEAVWASGCGDILVSDGELTDTAGWDSSLFGTNPRTAVGIKDDGSLIFYVVDGRSSSYSNGAKMSEVAADLMEKGCVTVANLDGGGSSVMALRVPGSSEAYVINSPSDGSSRSCASYILFVTNIPEPIEDEDEVEESSDDDETEDSKQEEETYEAGPAEYLYLAEEGKFILQGSQVEISFVASDSNFMPTEAPEDTYANSSIDNTIENGIYTALNAGDDGLEIVSKKEKLEGSGTLHVIEEVDSLTVTDSNTGLVPVFSDLEEGEQIQLSVSMTRLSREVLFSGDVITFTMEGDAGTVDESGLFTAGAPGTSGTLTVSAGGLSVVYEIVYEMSFADIEQHWAKDYIEVLSNAGIVNGIGDGVFGPDLQIIRGDFVLMMYRAFGEPEVTSSSTFTDVSESDYYYNAIAWAESMGIAQGNGDGTFSPGSGITREQAFTLLYRAFYADEDSEGDSGMLGLFNDGDAVSEYAMIPTSYLISLGIVSGSDGYILPQNEITRAEMAKILCSALYYTGE